MQAKWMCFPGMQMHVACTLTWNPSFLLWWFSKSQTRAESVRTRQTLAFVPITNRPSVHSIIIIIINPINGLVMHRMFILFVCQKITIYPPNACRGKTQMSHFHHRLNDFQSIIVYARHATHKSNAHIRQTKHNQQANKQEETHRVVLMPAKQRKIILR